MLERVVLIKAVHVRPVHFSMNRRFRLFEFIVLHALEKACGVIGILLMTVSKVVLDCSVECARLARQCSDEKTAVALFAMSARLLSAANRDAELIMDEAEPDTAQQSLPLAVAGGK